MKRTWTNLEGEFLGPNDDDDDELMMMMINEFDPGFLKARGGARICEALNRAIDMIEARKDTC